VVVDAGRRLNARRPSRLVVRPDIAVAADADVLFVDHPSACCSTRSVSTVTADIELLNWIATACQRCCTPTP
jgi:hypothetical protein